MHIHLPLLGAALASMLAANSASAWTGQSHRLTGRIAYEYLNPDVQAEVDRLISSAGGRLDTPLCPITNLEQAAIWSDCIRPHRYPGVTRHTERIPMCHPGPRASWCKGKCPSEQIFRATAILKDHSLEDAKRLKALATIVHLIGDIHQPLHAPHVAGGLKVHFRGQTLSFHYFWDSRAGILARRLGPGKDTVIEKNARDHHDEWSSGDANSWVMESYRLSVDRVFPKAGGSTCPQSKEPLVLPKNYARLAGRIAAQRLAQAGIRIAYLLNGALTTGAPNGK